MLKYIHRIVTFETKHSQEPCKESFSIFRDTSTKAELIITKEDYFHIVILSSLSATKQILS